MTIKSFIDNLTQKELGWTGAFSIGQSSKLAGRKELFFGIIYTCIDAIATKVSEAEWGLYKPKSDGTYTEVLKHPILEILKKPNNLQTFTDLMYLISSAIDISGQAFVYPVRTSMSSNRILELHLLDPSLMVTKTSKDEIYTRLIGYDYHINGKHFNLKPEEVINILRSHPLNHLVGLSTIAMAQYEGTSDLNAVKMNNAFYRNGAFPGGVISTDQDLKPDVFQMLKARIKQAYEGVENSYRMMFLTNGMKYNVTSPSQKDIQFIEQRKLNRDQILAIFKTPKSIVAVSEQLNKATAQVEYQAFMSNVVRPRLELIFDKFNQFLIPLFPDSEGLVLNYKDPTPVDAEQTLAEQTASVNVWRTVNEVRDMNDLDPIEGGDELIAPPEPEPDKDEPTEDDKDNPDDKEKPEDKPKEDDEEEKQKGGQPDPAKVRGRDNKAYTRKRNQYFKFKEADYARKAKNEYAYLIKEIKRTKVNKAIEDDFEQTPEYMFEQVMPDKQKRRTWEMGLFLLVLANDTQIWKTAQKQLNEAYDMKVAMNDTYERILSARASATAKSMSDTVYSKVKDTIAQSVARGNTNIVEVKREIGNILDEVAQWKSDQVAVTELAWAYGEAQQQTYRENDITKVKWLAATDACDECAGNDGVEVELGHDFPSGHDQEPVHPGCRCEIVPVFS